MIDNPGGCSSVMVFRQKVSPTFTEDDKLTMAIHMLKKLEPEIHIYQTRTTRQLFYKQINSLHCVNIPPHVLRHVYRTVTGDWSTEATSSEIYQRVQLAIESKDADLVIDLHHLNKGRPGDTSDIFFKELANMFYQITAADDRRHGVCHMSEFLSIRDLINQVREKIPDSAPIPSMSTVIHSFAPPNMYAKILQNYTRKTNLKFVVQRCQLRDYQTDAHWCYALFRYLQGNGNHVQRQIPSIIL